MRQRTSDDSQSYLKLPQPKLPQPQRTRQVSSITEQTLICSTQHSDDMSSSPIAGRRKLSNNDSLNQARSRGISGLSGDLNHTHASHSSNECEPSLTQQPRFADKVRRVAFEGATTPEVRNEEDAESSEENGGVSSPGGGALSPYH